MLKKELIKQNEMLFKKNLQLQDALVKQHHIIIEQRIDGDLDPNTLDILIDVRTWSNGPNVANYTILKDQEYVLINNVKYKKVKDYNKDTNE